MMRFRWRGIAALGAVLFGVLVRDDLVEVMRATRIGVEGKPVAAVL